MAKSGTFVIQKGKFYRTYEATGEIRCTKEGVNASFDVGHLGVVEYFHLLESDVV
jgi:hypothetical protein